jgi:hypothetical protein
LLGIADKDIPSNVITIKIETNTDLGGLLIAIGID